MPCKPILFRRIKHYGNNRHLEYLSEKLGRIVQMVSGSETINDLRDVMREMSSDNKGTHFTLTSLIPNDEPKIITTLPSAWVKEYLDRNYVSIDPVYLAARNSHGPYIWSNLDWTGDKPKELRQKMLTASIPLQGVTTVTRHAGEYLSAFSLSRYSGLMTSSRIQPANRLSFVGLGNVLSTRMLEIYGYKRNLLIKPLTAREFEALQLTSSGMTQAEIADHLGVRVDTVQSHMRSVREKFGAKTVSHAVALSVKYGIISV